MARRGPRRFCEVTPRCTPCFLPSRPTKPKKLRAPDPWRTPGFSPEITEMLAARMGLA